MQDNLPFNVKKHLSAEDLESMEKRRWPEGRAVNREESVNIPDDPLIFSGVPEYGRDPLAQLAQDHIDARKELDNAKGYSSNPDDRAAFIGELKKGVDVSFEKKLASLLNSVSRENRSNTPDFILAEFMGKCLFAFENANNSRERWYGKYLNILGKPGPYYSEERQAEHVAELQSIIHKFDEINKTRSFTDKEAYEYSMICMEWAKLAGRPDQKTTNVLDKIMSERRAERLDAIRKQMAELEKKELTDEEHSLYNGLAYQLSRMKSEDLQLLIPEMNQVNTRSPEGYLLNAALAILTTEFMTDSEYSIVFKKVRDLAVRIQADDQKRPDDELAAKPGFKNAGNRNEFEP